MLRSLKQRGAGLLRRVTGQNEVVDGLNNQTQLVIQRTDSLIQQIVNVERRTLDQIDGLAARSHRHGLVDSGVIKVFRPFAHTPIKVAPLVDIPYPRVALADDDPIQGIISAPEFQACAKFFRESPASERSLLGAESQALLYSTIRNQVPAHVVEIGSFRTGTSEAIARALHANGTGILHTVDPFGMESVPALIAQWPQELQDRVYYYPSTSMTFFLQMETEDIRPDLVLVDGNHDYEFAAFDIMGAARLIKPDGLVFVDNISQAGPFFAAVDFMASHPGWREYGSPAANYRVEYALDDLRTDIAGTDFTVLRAPRAMVLGERPTTLGQQPWHGAAVRALEVAVGDSAPNGTLYTQAVLRGFGERLAETASKAAVELRDARGSIQIPFERPLPRGAEFTSMTIEVWLTWKGDRPLHLSRPPVVLE